MRVLVNVKQLGSRREKVKGVPFELAREPRTVGELVAEAVRTCVAAYNARFEQDTAAPLAQADIEARAELGKIAFGFNHGGKRADEATAIAHAQQAYADGLFRVFIGAGECGALADAVHLREDDALTFIRLTMLTGGFFLPFADDDPKTAEIISKALLLAEDDKLRDPGILGQLNR